jgi:hypothetical protein
MDGADGADGADGMDGADGADGADGMDGADGAAALFFTYAAFDRIDTTAATPTGSLQLPIGGVAYEAFDHDGDDTTPEIMPAHIGQCAAVTSPIIPARYRAIGPDETHSISMEDSAGASLDTQGFTVDFAAEDATMVFGGVANVAAGLHQYVLNATAGDQSAAVKWDLRVSARALPVDATDDGRNDRLGGTDGANAETADGGAVANDWADHIPADFEGNNDSDQNNVPQLSLVATTQTIEGVIGSNNDEDVYWIGELAPGWKLEVTAEGTSTVTTGSVGAHNDVSLELIQRKSGTDAPATLVQSDDPSFNHQIGSATGGLTCYDYYLKVSGEEGEYQMAWRLTAPTE